MSTHTLPPPPLEVVQKKLKSLYDRRFNLNADFLYIRLDVGEMTEHYRLTSACLFLLLWQRDDSEHLPQQYAFLKRFSPQAIGRRIIFGRVHLENMERWMCRKMHSVKELREISFEIAEEIRKIESEVMVGMADMFLEETRILRTWDAMASEPSATTRSAT